MSKYDYKVLSDRTALLKGEIEYGALFTVRVIQKLGLIKPDCPCCSKSSFVVKSKPEGSLASGEYLSLLIYYECCDLSCGCKFITKNNIAEEISKKEKDE